MTNNQKTTIKHILVVVFSFLIPLLPTLLAHVNFGTWTNVEQAVLTLLGALYVAFTGNAVPILSSNQSDATVTDTKIQS
jgi:hypothetical protein